MYGYFVYWFHKLCVIKANVSSDEGPWDKILSDGGPPSNLCQFDVKKFVLRDT